ncbi:MAG TPA: acyl-CoA dehydrogenase family protein, partial [Candidatus Binataceae bacterium]|nr:acyl-CoA dehydrogenase family protein [Candidatus Binataceae bacterium]
MDLNFTSEEEEFRLRVRRFLEQELPKAGMRPEREGREDKAWLEKAKAWQRKMHSAGYVALAWPKQYGGQEMDPVRQSIVNEEMVRANAPYMVGGSGLGMLGPTLISWGTEEQKKEHLPKILTAEEIW